MKNVFIIILSFFFLSGLQAQKIQYKKGKILVDKKEKYILKKTKKGGFMQRSHFTLKDMKGNDILVFTDTSFYYTQLSNEEEKRKAFSTPLVSAPSLNKSAIIPVIAGLNFGKSLTRLLKQAEFFKKDQIDNQLYEAFINSLDLEKIEQNLSSIDTVNAYRTANAKKMEEDFGPLMKRKPGIISVSNNKITEGSKMIAHVTLDKKGKYAAVYKVINKEGQVIAKFSIIPSENRGHLRTLVDNKAKAFRYKITNGVEPSWDHKLNLTTNYLVNYGYL